MTDVHYPAAPLIWEGLSLRFLREYAIVPLTQSAAEIVVAMADPTDTTSLDALALFTGQTVRAVADERDRILARLDQLYGSRDAILHKNNLAPASPETSGHNGALALRDQALDAPVVARVTALLAAAVEAGASDIHLEPQEQRLLVRLRIDGVLRERESPPNDHGGGLPPPRMMKETSGRKVADRGRETLWRLDPAPNVTRRTDSHPGLPP